MNKKLIVLISLALVAVLAVCFAAGCGKKGDTAGKVTVTVTYSVGEGDNAKTQSSTVSVDEGATVYDAMLATGWTIDAEDSQWGKYIHGIDGNQDSSNTGWIYTESGNEVMDGADSHIVVDGASYDWVMISW